MTLVEQIRAMSDGEFEHWKPDKLNEDPDPEAVVPTGMCGSPKKCYVCPSTFLCAMKARKEKEIIEERA